MSETDLDTAPRTSEPPRDTAPPPEASHDEDDRLSPDFVDAVIEHVEAGEIDAARALVAPLHPADIADLFELAPAEHRRAIAAALAEMIDGDVLAEMNEWVRDELMEALGPHEVAEIAAQLDTDDAVAIIEEMEEDDQRAVLRAMEPDDRAAIEEALSYPEESAGRLMRHALVAVPESWSVGDTIDYLRSTDELPENFYVIYAIDGEFKPTGRLLLGSVLSHKRDVRIAELIVNDTFAVHTRTDQEEVAYLFRKYALVEAPVVNDSGMLVGTITVDDVVDVIQEEEEEDYLRAGGVTEQDFQASIWETVRTRFRWLFVNLITAVLAANVIGLFQHSIEKIVALAIMMPMVASMGGNTGTQSVTVAVRSIATKHLTDANRYAYVRKEMLIGLVNGALLGLVMALGAYAWFHDALLSLVLFGAALINMTMAGLFGAFFPILLTKMKIDPAIASGIFLTTVTDCVGFFAFLGLATLILL